MKFDPITIIANGKQEQQDEDQSRKAHGRKSRHNHWTHLRDGGMQSDSVLTQARAAWRFIPFSRSRRSAKNIFSKD